MTEVMTLRDVVQLIVLCAVIFLPLGAWAFPKLAFLMKWCRWKVTVARRFKEAGSLEEFLKKEMR